MYAYAFLKPHNNSIGFLEKKYIPTRMGGMGKEITEIKFCKLGKKEELIRNLGDQKNLIFKLDR